MKHVLLIIAIVFGLSLHAQIYSVTTPIKAITKTTSHGIMHDFIQVNNLIGTDFQMRWIAEFGGGGKNGCPPTWTYTVADPDSMYDPLNDADSADYTLSGTVPTYNKIIIGIDHHGDTGFCSVNFRIFPLSDPSAETFIGFDITVNPGAIGMEEITITPRNIVFPNPSTAVFNLKDKVEEAVLYDAVGRRLKQYQKVNRIDLSGYSSGIYYLESLDQDGSSSKIKLIKN